MIETGYYKRERERERERDWRRKRGNWLRVFLFTFASAPTLPPPLTTTTSMRTTTTTTSSIGFVENGAIKNVDSDSFPQEVKSWNKLSTTWHQHGYEIMGEVNMNIFNGPSTGFFYLFSTIFKENCWLQRELNSDSCSRMLARWPLEHHYGPLFGNFFDNLCFKWWEQHGNIYR